MLGEARVWTWDIPVTYGDGEGSKLFIEDFFVKIPSLGTKFSVRTHYSRAAMGQNCSLFDKSMKLCRIISITQTNSFRYGAQLNWSQELTTAHVIKYPTWKRGCGQKSFLNPYLLVNSNKKMFYYRSWKHLLCSDGLTGVMWPPPVN